MRMASVLPRRAVLSVLSVLVASAALLAGCGTTVPVAQQTGPGATALGGPLADGRPTTTGSTSSADGSGTVAGGSTPADGTTRGGSSVRSTDASGGGMPATSAGTGGAGVIPKTGPGWDERSIYVGVVTVTDAPTVGHLLGVESLDYGEQNAYTKAMLDYVNSHGGLFGRSLVPVAYDVSSTSDLNTSGQAACTRFTQDRRVAVALGAVPVDTYYACLKKARVPVISSGYGQFFTAKEMSRYRGWVYFWGTLSYERLVPVWLDRLRAMGYFTGWSTTAGAPAQAPVKVGLLHNNSPYDPGAFAHLKAQLQRRGIEVAAEFQASNPNDYSNAVLQFRAAKVTHLFLDSTAALFYPAQAEQQHYYARFAVNSNDFIQPFLQATAPAAQLRGMMGLGWVPAQDVDLTHKPAPTPGQARCFKIMRDRGADVSQNNYQYTANTVCDSFFIFLELARAGRGLAPGNLLNSVGVAAADFPWASQMGTGVVPTDLSLAPVAQGLEYVESCRCVQYTGPVVRVP